MSELKMTVVCRSCDNQYGAWRTHCPACGTTSHYKAPAPEKKERHQKRSEAQRPKREHECILCRRGNSSMRCPSCTEEIHDRCLKYHIDDCVKFVLERDAVYNAALVSGAAMAKEAERMGRLDIADRVREAMRKAGMEVHT